MENKIRPLHNDVICGRDGITHTHPGNKYYRFLIRRYKTSYITSCRRHDKINISRSLVSDIRNRHGRFLKQDKVTGRWYDIGDDKATLKTSQALRENQPLLREELKEVGAQKMEEKLIELEMRGGIDQDQTMEEFRHHNQNLLASKVLDSVEWFTSLTQLKGSSNSMQGSVNQPLSSNDTSVRYQSNAVTTESQEYTNINSSLHDNFSTNSSPALSARRCKAIPQKVEEYNLKPVEKSQMVFDNTSCLSPPKQGTNTKLSSKYMCAKPTSIKSLYQITSGQEDETLNTDKTEKMAPEGFNSNAYLDSFASYVNSNVPAFANQRTFAAHFQNEKSDYLRKGAVASKNNLGLKKLNGDITGTLDENIHTNTATRKGSLSGSRKHSQHSRKKRIVCKFVFPNNTTF